MEKNIQKNLFPGVIGDIMISEYHLMFFHCSFMFFSALDLGVAEKIIEITRGD